MLASGSPKSSPILTAVKLTHRALVHTRRVRVLAQALATQIPQNASVLDIGCGDGSITALILEQRPDLRIQGVEFLPRPDCQIPCKPFDGRTLPFPENSVDLCLLVDVLHHTTDVTVLLREATRVARKNVLLKDHLSENSFDHATLRLMDWVGNRPHGVVLPYNYQSRSQWHTHFASTNLVPQSFLTHLPLYPAPTNLIFGRNLHFLALLDKIAPP